MLDDRHLLANWYVKHHKWVPTQPLGCRPTLGDASYRDWNQRNEVWVAYMEELNELRISERRSNMYWATILLIGPPVVAPSPPPSNPDARRRLWRSVQEWRNQFDQNYKDLWGGTVGYTGRPANRYYKHANRFWAWWRLQTKLHEMGKEVLWDGE